VIHLLTFLPPITVVLFYPNAFIMALEYAGIYCIVLLILLPAWMAWRGRYTKKIAHGYQVWGGKPLLVVLILFSLVMMLYALVDKLRIL
jgi:tyrosine-specific transport protein